MQVLDSKNKGYQISENIDKWFQVIQVSVFQKSL